MRSKRNASGRTARERAAEAKPPNRLSDSGSPYPGGGKGLGDGGRHLTANLAGPRKSVQILRTLPDKDGGENTIQRLYYQVAHSARNYIYVENQYFQYAPWLQHLKAKRKAYVDLHRKVGSAAANIPALHLMVVLPTPERTQMVPRTHDAIKELGYGNSMPRQTDMLEDEIKRYKRDKERYEQDLNRYNAATPINRQFMSQPRPPVISDVAKTYTESGGGTQDGDIRDSLEKGLGLKTLVASLWTYDHNYPNAEQRKRERALAAPGKEDLPPAQALEVAQFMKGQQDALNAQRYREIYIHSKLMIADDSVFTVGSANINARSFAADGELNMVTDCRFTAERLRREVWGMHSGGVDKCQGGTAQFKDMAEAFDAWLKLIAANGKAKDVGLPITGFLVPLEDKRTSRIRLG